MTSLRYLIPLGVFLVISGFLAVGLFLNPGQIPSPLIGKPAPEFELQQLHDPRQVVTHRDMAGQVWMLNVFASWCVTCRHEHPLLVELNRHQVIPIVGLNYKDRREDAINWLRGTGNPYVAIGHDLDGRVGMDYGVYGTPETYIIDAQGIIRYKHIGPMSGDVLEKKILPMIRELQQS